MVDRLQRVARVVFDDGVAIGQLISAGDCREVLQDGRLAHSERVQAAGDHFWEV